MRRKKFTLKDIALQSGVSRATVTAVLQGSPGVSEKTRNKVLDVIRENNYQSRLVARSILGHLSRMIGVVVRDINNPCFTEMFIGINEVLRGEDYHTICQSTDESHDEEVRTVKELEPYELGGFILASVQEDKPHDHIRRLIETGKPLVTIGRVPDLDTNYVDFEDRKGSQKATDYLIAKGHKRITCLAGPATSTSSKERVVGFVESLVQHGLNFEDYQIVRSGSRSNEGYEAALRALADPNTRPTALICFNDLVAIGVYKAANELGLSIPGDLSVVGFDDIEMAAIMGPPLTTVSLFPRKIGSLAAETLLAVIRGEHSGAPRQITFETELVERASVRTM